MNGLRYMHMHNEVTLELSQPVCIACSSGLISEWFRERNITGSGRRCCL